MPASRQRASRSAPTKPCVMAARCGRSTSCGQRHAAAVDLQDLLPAVLVGDGDGDLAVEAARPAQGGVQRVGEVGRRQHDHVLPLGQPVHQGQQLGHHALLHVAHDPLAPRGDGVDLVEEDDARGAAGRLVEDLAQVGLALAVELVDDLRPVDGEEVGLGLVGHGPGDERLAAAGRPVAAARPWARRCPAARTAPGTAAAARRSPGCAPTAASGRRCPRRRCGAAAAAAGRSPCGCRPSAGVSDAMTTGPAGAVLLTRKSAQRLPNSVARMRSPAITGRPSSRLPMYSRSRLEGVRPCGSEHQLLGRLDGDAADHHRFAEAHAGVLADDPVDLQVLLAAMLLEGRQELADGPPLARDLHHVADVHAQPLHVGGIDAGNPAAHVLAGRLADLQRDLLDRRMRVLTMIGPLPLEPNLQDAVRAVPSHCLGGEAAGQDDFLAVAFLAALGGIVSRSPASSTWTSFLLTPGISARTRTWSSSSWTSTRGSRTSSTTGLPGGLPMDVAEGLDLQFRSPCRRVPS